MNTKKALSIILLVSLLSQGNAFGMRGVGSKLLNSGSTRIFCNTIPSKVASYSKFSKRKTKKSMGFKKLKIENEQFKIKNKELLKEQAKKLKKTTLVPVSIVMSKEAKTAWQDFKNNVTLASIGVTLAHGAVIVVTYSSLIAYFLYEVLK